jgi:hypothetical protein
MTNWMTNWATNRFADALANRVSKIAKAAGHTSAKILSARLEKRGTANSRLPRLEFASVGST